MPEGDTQLILQAIKAQGDKIGNLADAVSRLVEKVSAQPIGNGRGGQAWAIATFTSVILALAAIGYSKTSGNAVVSALRAQHQSAIVTMIAEHQKERVYELDSKLQKEIKAAQDLFDQAERDSAYRHETQQNEFDEFKAEVKGWFKAPRLKNNHRGEE